MSIFGSTASTFPWVKLTSIEQLDELYAQSATVPVLLFKHSTTCSISAMTINRLETKWTAAPESCICVYLDLLAFRPLSNAITEKTGVRHESPQAILLKDGQVVYSASHGYINAAEIQSFL